MEPRKTNCPAGTGAWGRWRWGTWMGTGIWIYLWADGWLEGVTAGDLDGDGRMDIIASNWGRNTKYEHHRQEPLRLYYGDFAEDGGMQLFETHYESSMMKQVPVRLLDVAVKAMPFLTERFSSYRAYADAGIEA